MMKHKKMDIELLYFDDCPSWKNALVTLDAIVEEHGISSKISLIRVETQEEAVLHRFVGSPTIRVKEWVFSLPIKINLHSVAGYTKLLKG